MPSAEISSAPSWQHSPLTSLVQPLLDAWCEQSPPGAAINVDALLARVEEALFQHDSRWQQRVPSLNVVDVETVPSGSLVHYRCMVQDNGCQPEIYVLSALLASDYTAVASNNLSSSSSGMTRERVTSLLQDFSVAAPSSASMDQKSIQFGDRFPYYACAVAGETAWVVQERADPESNLLTAMSSLSMRDCTVPKPTQRVLLKNYGTNGVGACKLNSVLDVYGVLEHGTEGCPSPVIHIVTQSDAHTSGRHPALSSASFTASPSSVEEVRAANDRLFTEQLAAAGIDVEQLRAELINWLAREALLGDTLTAEFLVMHLTSRIYSRVGGSAVGALSMTINRLPVITATASIPDMTAVSDSGAVDTVNLMVGRMEQVLQLLVPSVTTVGLSVENLNAESMLPTISFDENTDSNCVKSGCALQLPDGHSLILDETAMKAGTLSTTGLRNLAALQQLLTAHEHQYCMDVGGAEEPVVAVETSVNVLLLSEGSSSMAARGSSSTAAMTQSGPLLATDVAIPLVPQLDAHAVLETEVTPHPRLPLFRLYVACVRSGGSVSYRYNIPDHMADMIASDFVEWRKASGGAGRPACTEDDLYRRLNLARYDLLGRDCYQLDELAWRNAQRLDEGRLLRCGHPATCETGVTTVPSGDRVGM